MRDAHAKFKDLGATVVIIAKDDAETVAKYWQENNIPFTGIPDPDGRYGDLYSQEAKLGLMPAVFVIDQKGIIQFAHYGTGMKDIPTVDQLLDVLKSL